MKLKNSVSALEGGCGVVFASPWGFFSFLKKLNGTFIKRREISAEGLDTRILHATVFRGRSRCAFRTQFNLGLFLVVTKLIKSLC